ncbi:MAG TPA: CmpA/NrtA family ABC transporter substrate-binding protein [Methylophilaceae bacterium]|nr:CmpA/NrtA family ABC transporter substrate-binding protein [Methylophilaceae bacterium]
MTEEKKGMSRREFIKASAGAGLMELLPAGEAQAWVAGSDAPEKKELRVGFIALTDCASVVMAAVQKFDEKYGIKIIPSRESSWAAIRDKLLAGELDAAQALYGLVYGVQLGIGGVQKDMNILMALNNNGQGITLASRLGAEGVIDGATLAQRVARQDKSFVFAQTFPTGTHAMWLYYWLATHGIDPFRDVRNIVVPPPNMVANIRGGNTDGFCAGEPWNQCAINERVGFSVAATQDIWPDHPEKVLGTTEEWVQQHPNAARALTAAILEASRWIDASAANRHIAAGTIAQQAYVNTDVDVILGRMLGRYENGLGQSKDDPHAMKFHADGAVNFPYLSDAMWFMTQHRRWGFLREDPDYLAVAQRVNRIDIYAQAATQLNVALPDSSMRSSRLIDGVIWDGSDPTAYANSFSIHA